MLKLRGASIKKFNHFSRGLVGVWVCDELTGSVIFDCSANQSDAIINGSPSWIASTQGSALYLDGGTQLEVATDSINLPTNNLSILVKVLPSRTGVAEAIWSAENTLTDRHSLIYRDITDVFHISLGDGVNIADVAFSQVSQRDEWADIGLAWDFSNKVLRGFRNGFEDAVAAFNSPLQPAIFNPIVIGGRPIAPFNNFQGAVSLVYLWDRQLEESDFRYLYSDPYAIFDNKVIAWAVFDSYFLSQVLYYPGSETQASGVKVGIGYGSLTYPGSTMSSVEGVSNVLIYGGSQIIATGVKVHSGSGVLIYGGSTIEAFDDCSYEFSFLIPVYFSMENQPFDPFSVKYTIYDAKGNTVSGQVDRVAMRNGAGHYYADFAWMNISGIKPGTYKIIWAVQQTLYSQLISKADSISVIVRRNETCAAPSVTSGYNPTNRQSGTCNSPGAGGSCNQSGTCNEFDGSMQSIAWRP